MFLRYVLQFPRSELFGLSLVANFARICAESGGVQRLFDGYAPSRGYACVALLRATTTMFGIPKEISWRH